MTYKFSEQSQAARKSILSKLKEQVAGSDYEKLPDETAFTYPKLSRTQMLDNFVTLLKNNHAEVIKVGTSELVATVVEQLQKRQINSILYGTDGPYAQLLEDFIKKDKRAKITFTPFNFQVQENKQSYFNDYAASITSSRWAIAETGTVVLWPTPGEPRTMSLVPPVHFVVVDANTLHTNFASLIKQQNWKDKMPTNALLISGPSKTADIQQTLAFGAHGPKELIVLLLNSQL